MSDWYTEDVRKALEIVPVAWTNECADAYQLQKWGCDTYVRAKLIRGRWKHFGAFQNFEAQALIEKALREWLEERHIFVNRCQRWASWYVMNLRPGAVEKTLSAKGRWLSVTNCRMDEGSATWANYLAALTAAVLATKEGES